MADSPFRIPGNPLAAILGIVLALGMWALTFFEGTVNPAILDTHVRALGMESTGYQRLGYLAALLLLALGCAYLLLRPDHDRSAQPSRAETTFFLVAVLVIFVSTEWRNNQAAFFILTLAGLAAYRRRAGFRAAVERAVATLGARKGLLRALLFAALLGSVIFLWIVPLFAPLHIDSPTTLRSSEAHYAVTVLGGIEAIDDGESAGKRNYYGPALPGLVAGMHGLLDTFGASEVDLPLIVELYQIVALALVTAILLTVSRRRAPALLLLAIALTAYTFSNVGLGVHFPNQSGIRYIVMLAGLLLYALLLRFGRLRIEGGAVIGAAGVLLSPETGLALTAGLLTAGVLSNYRPSARLTSIVTALVRFVLVFAATVALARLAIGTAASSDPDFDLLSFIGLFGVSGYGGLVDRLSFGAGMMFLVAASVLLNISAAARSAAPSSADLWRAALATIVLVWMYYYVNRMSEWNLWFHWILFVFLLAPGIGAATQRASDGKRVPGTALFAGVVVALVAAQTAVGLNALSKRVGHWNAAGLAPCPAENRLHGYCVAGFSDQVAARQLAALAQFDPQTTFVLSGYATAARLRGFNAQLPVYDAMEYSTYEEEAAFVRWLDSHGPAMLLVDSTTSDVARVAPEHNEQLHRYVSRVRNYSSVGERDGWLILERRDSVEQPAARQEAAGSAGNP